MDRSPAPPRVTETLVIGAGIAGAGCACELAADGPVILLERESQPGYHTTGRSAALYTRSYGNAPMRALTRASLDFFLAPPAGFSSTPLLSPRGALLVARTDQQDALAALAADLGVASEAKAGSPLRWLDGGQARALVPCFDPGQLAAALHDVDASDIDVHALHHGYLRRMRAAGGELVADAEVTALEREPDRWRVCTRAGDFLARVVVDAAGAWADEVAVMAGAAPVGLVPKRRTAITFDPPGGLAVSGWPAVIDVDEQWYFKPEAGRLLASPADETPSPPCDAQPDEYDIAVLVDRLSRATTLVVPRIHARWAGLRSFAADKTLVCGFDPVVPGFFWLAAQGGYGIQTAPAASMLAAALIAGRAVPQELEREGVVAEDFAPARCGGLRAKE